MSCVGAMESPTSTFALLEKARTGDREALSRVFEKYQRRLAVLVHFKLSPRARAFEEVEDIVQETPLRAFRDIHRFSYQAPGSFLRWLSAIADHAIIAAGVGDEHDARVSRYDGNGRYGKRKRTGN